MIRPLCLVALACALNVGLAHAQDLPAKKVLAKGFVTPESVVVGPDGRIYVSQMGERDKDGDGQVLVISGDKGVPFATGLDDPKGIVLVGKTFYVTDKTKVLKIDRTGKKEVLADKAAFPKEPLFLNDITADQLGTLYVSDSGDRQGKEGKIFAITREGKVSLVADSTTHPEIKFPNGVLAEGEGKLLYADLLTGVLHRINLADKAMTKVAEGFGTCDGIVKDAAGNFFVSDVRNGKVFRYSPGNEKPELLAEGFGLAADICAGPTGRSLIVPDMKNGEIVDLPVAPSVAWSPLLKDLKNPESVVIGPDGFFYISVIGEFGKDGDGNITSLQPGKQPKVFATGLDDPKGIIFSKDAFFVTDVKKVVKIDKTGKTSVFATPEAFPKPPLFLNDIVADKDGNLYVTDSGDLKGAAGAVYKITAEGKVSTLIDSSNPAIKTPNGLLFAADGGLLILDFASGELNKLDLAGNKLSKVAEGFLGGDGLAYDIDGNLYVSQWLTGKVHVLVAGSDKPKLFSNQFSSAADSCLDPRTGRIVIPDMRAGTLVGIPVHSPVPTDIDDSPLPVVIEQAWPNITTDRPIILTHANDGSGRTFVASQKGKVYILPKDQAGEEAKLFFDLSKKTSYKDNENEEGFLGFAFHPKFKQNGQFFVYYTTTEKPRLSVISRFKVNPDSPDMAQASSEEELMRIPQPYWNHNGGTICFGPDGFLYVGLGDGGSANDPQGNGQNVKTLLGSILRIDVDNKDQGKQYAVPKDNPFLSTAGAQPEIWAIGLRNIWRMSFDRQTGDCWVADVGQNIWEEINVVTKGANLGWNPRESLHRFTAAGSPPKPEYLEPIWEYHHDIGKSITGGHVYRGKVVPELTGHYLYADYVTGRVWGLAYDVKAKKVLANRQIFGNIEPVMSFGEDEAGEVYYLTVQGRIYKFASAKP